MIMKKKTTCRLSLYEFITIILMIWFTNVAQYRYNQEMKEEFQEIRQVLEDMTPEEIEDYQLKQEGKI